MNAEEYNKLINERNVLDHTTLNVTLKELMSRQERDLAGEIERILENDKIVNPEQQSNSYKSTAYYTIHLHADAIDRIVTIFYELEESHVGEDGGPTPTSSFYASLADKWENLT